MSDAISIVEGLDFMVSLAHGQVHPEEVYSARGVADRAPTRAGHLGSTLVLALVGGTGSGKSSLLNALAGEEVASTSPVRPHTSEPLAWIPETAETSLRGLLDRLGVRHRIGQDRFGNLAVLDMIDVDSVALENRDRVERLLPEIDMLVWVLDPFKYADPILHRRFIAPLAGSSDRLLFVLNQVDRLDVESLRRVRADLIRLLAEDGIDDPLIFETAADPPSGSSQGIEPLALFLSTRLDEKQIQIAKIVDDARRAGRSIAGAAGVTAGGSLEFGERWRLVLDTVKVELNLPSDTAGFEEALRLLEALILRLATESGGGFGLRIRQSFRNERIESELRAAMEAARHRDDQESVLEEELQERFGAPIRTILWERASLVSAATGLAVDSAAVEETWERGRS